MANLRLCSITGCHKPLWARGWCGMHYDRWRRHGDPLKVMIAAHGEPEKFFAAAVLHEGDDCLPWPYCKVPNGYGTMLSDGRMRYVHHLVCQAVNGAEPSDRHQAAHECGNRICINPRHLSWKTPKENKCDELVHGTRRRGETHLRAKLTLHDVAQIRSLAGTVPQKQIAQMFGVCRQTVGHIQRGNRWNHI